MQFVSRIFLLGVFLLFSSSSFSQQALPALQNNNLSASDSKRDFERAQELMKLGKEQEALLSLTDFLRRYPQNSLSSEVQFLMGELFFRQRKYEEAINEYLKVHKFGLSGNEKAPWASLKVGESWYQLKHLDRAKIEWQAVRRKFPNSEAAEVARSHLAGVP